MGKMTVADYRLESRAERELWPVTQSHREECVENALIDLRDADPRVRKAARDYLLRVDEANDKKTELEQKRIADEHARKLQYIELLVKLGVVVDDGGPDRDLAKVSSTK